MIRVDNLTRTNKKVNSLTPPGIPPGEGGGLGRGPVSPTNLFLKTSPLLCSEWHQDWHCDA